MNLEIESYKGELRFLPETRDAYLESMVRRGVYYIESITRPPIQIYDEPETIEELSRQLEINSKLTSELDALEKEHNGQQEKIRQMALTVARLQARLDSISGIATRVKSQ